MEDSVKDELLRDLYKALLSCGVAYDILEEDGYGKHLPGLARCKQDRADVLKRVNELMPDILMPPEFKRIMNEFKKVFKE